MTQIASGLAYLHLEHRVCHRDLKPSNILCRDCNLETPGCVRIGDFGFARTFEAPGTACFADNLGTLEYYAPELVENLLSPKSHKRLYSEAVSGAVCNGM